MIAAECLGKRILAIVTLPNGAPLPLAEYVVKELSPCKQYARISGDVIAGWYNGAAVGVVCELPPRAST